MEDIFEFWASVPAAARAHPADVPVLARVGHTFQPTCLPGPFKGRLRSAPVVLLFLSAGFSDYDLAHAESDAGQAYYLRSRTGDCDLPSHAEHEGSFSWSSRIVRQFGVTYEDVRDRIAFLNISPYKSKDFNDWHMLSALPSCRVAIGWAQSVLFREAENEDRVVVCMRSARHWGLEPGQTALGGLFAPTCGRNGVMNHGPMREQVTAAVQKAIRR